MSNHCLSSIFATIASSTATAFNKTVLNQSEVPVLAVDNHKANIAEKNVGLFILKLD